MTSIRHIIAIILQTLAVLIAAVTAPTLKAAIRTYGSKEGLEDNYVTSIAADSIGMVYLTTPTGVYTFDGIRLRPIPSELPDSLLSVRLISDDKGSITGLNDGRFLRFDGMTFHDDDHPFNRLSVLTGHRVTNLQAAGNRVFFIAENDTLYTADIQCRRATPIGSAYGHSHIALADRRIWLFDGMRNGAVHYPIQTSGAGTSGREILEGYLVKAICDDRDGGIIAGTNNDGLLRLKREERREERYTISAINAGDENNALSRHISALMCGERSVYAGSSKNGLQILTDTGCRIRRIPTGIASDIAFIQEDSIGRLWVGYDGGGLHVFDNLEAMNMIDPFNEKDIPSELVVGVSRGKGDRWYGTYGNGLFRLEGAGVSRMASDSIAFCRHIHSFPDGSILAGTFNNGLFLIDRTGKTSRHFLKGECITGMAEHEGKIAVAVSGGIHMMDIRTGNLTKMNIELPARKSIRCLAADSRGLLWAGTTSGTVAFDSKGQRVFSADASDGLSGRIVRAITEDREGNIWLTTATGIDRLQPVADQSGNPSFRLLSIRHDDIPGEVDFYRYALYAANDGRIIAGAAGSLIEVDPARLTTEPSSTAPYITGLMVDGKHTGPGEKVRGGRIPLQAPIISSDRLKLDHYHGLTLEFSTLDPSTAISSTYEYKIDKGDWIPLATPSLTLAELAPGTHQLSVRTAGSDAERRITIEIAPPFWKSTWAYILYALILAGLLWWGYRRLTGGYRKEILTQSIKTIDAREERTLPSPDEIFLAKARKTVEENLTDEEFTVEAFAAQLAMSRSNLYKKINAITGNSPNEFLRIIRIQRGKAIIDEGETVISQVAFQVGLSPKVFSKYFKEEYGMTPSSYITERSH